MAQGRLLGMESITVENIPAVGDVQEENEDIISLFPDYTMPDLKRLVFWRSAVDAEEAIGEKEDSDVIGYAIVKHDVVPTYQLQYRNSMTSGIWSNVPNVSVTNSIGATLTVTNFGGALGPQRLYRFAITP
jgi:hypothetical protein